MLVAIRAMSFVVFIVCPVLSLYSLDSHQPEAGLNPGHTM